MLIFVQIDNSYLKTAGFKCYKFKFENSKLLTPNQLANCNVQHLKRMFQSKQVKFGIKSQLMLIFMQIGIF